MKAVDIMTTKVVTIDSLATITQAARLTLGTATLPPYVGR